MTLRSRVIAMREIEAGASVGYGGRWKASKRARIAVVAGGYGDGYDRHAVNGTPVLIQGKRAPVIGRVSMDMITVDISHLDDVYIGSEAVLWGMASCGAYLSVDEVARYCNTISYTLLTGVMPRGSPENTYHQNLRYHVLFVQLFL
ncbi:alanine racemase-like protein [Idiomarina fontislapidosi]|uniref:Alanine racemase C-terminal domain-containing protein n=1 Tax=Idiomarina fontislapidosi TaxID=263723 RepID=A0A432XY73_9GAMM|nr:alanine racemase C-terminal domain-containing protein [Idiomarina fontislapidosi]PYE32845.1 alanine racemase-like protein [Idiomarina fontislapidosi]RUO53715.1 hypothetical protein CWE25_07450 [Idiomarina fontislapidosi]